MSRSFNSRRGRKKSFKAEISDRRMGSGWAAPGRFTKNLTHRYERQEAQRALLARLREIETMRQEVEDALSEEDRALLDELMEDSILDDPLEDWDESQSRTPYTQDTAASMLEDMDTTYGA